MRISSKLVYNNVSKIYIDGAKFKGSASSKRTIDRAGFKKWVENLEEEIKNLLKEAEAIGDPHFNHEKPVPDHFSKVNIKYQGCETLLSD